MVAYNTFKISLKTKSGLGQNEFDRKFARVERIIDRLKKAESLSLVFKGKWLTNLLVEEIRQHFAGRPMNFDNLGARIVAAAMATFDFESDWICEHFRGLSRLTSRLP